jgi:predicted PurR-regulated permease PerM
VGGLTAEPGARRPTALTILATLAVVAALYFGRGFLVPVALAILFNTLLRPFVRRLEAAHLSAPVGATLVLALVLGVVSVAGLLLSDPVRTWTAEAPQSVAAVESRLRRLRGPAEQLSDAARRIEGAAQGAPQRETASSSSAAGGTRPATRVFGLTATLVGQAVEVILLTFLLLASGDLFLQKLVKVLPLRGEKRAAVRIAGEVEEAVFRYMAATALINLGQGTVVGLAMWLLHMPSPVLWGVLTFFMEFIPYLGAAFVILLLTIAGLASFDNVGHALLAPGAYLLITTLQNNLVSPIAYGRRLRLNPVAVLVGVLFWWFLWGVPGAFLAVPVIATAKIVADQIEDYAPLGEFLGA